MSATLSLINETRKSVGLNIIREDLGHVTEAAEWTARFLGLAQRENVFDGIAPHRESPSLESSMVIANFWYKFSHYIPQYLCQAAAKLRDNKRRFQLIQIAHEELGSGKSSHIHPDLYRKSCQVAGVAHAIDDHSISMDSQAAVDLLKVYLRECGHDEEIMGLCLGLEITANELIETVLQLLAQNKKSYEEIEKTLFFRIHRVGEDEHIRICTVNFLEFCETDIQKQMFINGFNKGLKFWKNFWSTCAFSIEMQKVMNG